MGHLSYWPKEKSSIHNLLLIAFCMQSAGKPGSPGGSPLLLLPFAEREIPRPVSDNPDFREAVYISFLPQLRKLHKRMSQELTVAT